MFPMPKVEDYIETTPCGVKVRYTVNEMDIITYHSFNTKPICGKVCKGCTWFNLCDTYQTMKDIILK